MAFRKLWIRTSFITLERHRRPVRIYLLASVSRNELTTLRPASPNDVPQNISNDSSFLPERNYRPQGCFVQEGEGEGGGRGERRRRRKPKRRRRSLPAVFPEASPRKPSPWRVNCRETSPFFFPSLSIINPANDLLKYYYISLKTRTVFVPFIWGIFDRFFWNFGRNVSGFSNDWRSEIFVKSRFLFFFYFFFFLGE